jgi:flagellar basal-body rod modification protein FlgD
LFRLLAQSLLIDNLIFEKGFFMSSTSSTTSASNLQMDYMTLLVTQLQNQNPLDPIDNNQMAAQLAQFSQLQQLENMNSSFSSVLEMTQKSYATSLIGKTASYYTTGSDGSVTTASGLVQGVGTDTDGKLVLNVGGYALGLDDIVAVK